MAKAAGDDDLLHAVSELAGLLDQVNERVAELWRSLPVRRVDRSTAGPRTADRWNGRDVQHRRWTDG